MQNTLARVKTNLQNKAVDLSILGELEVEYEDLVKKADELETLLIMIVRTGWPWDEEGEPNEIYHAAKDGYAGAMVEARELLGLNLNTRITRTERKT